MNGQHRVSLEVAQKMKALGYPQDGCDVYWVKENRFISLKQPRDFSTELEGYKVSYAAPCVGRLGDDLINSDGYVNGDIKYKDTYYWVNDEAYEKEADARGIMLCELVERGLLKW